MKSIKKPLKDFAKKGYMNKKTYKAIDLLPLTDEQKRTLDEIDKLKDSELDTSDSPECSGNGGFYYVQKISVKD